VTAEEIVAALADNQPIEVNDWGVFCAFADCGSESPGDLASHAAECPWRMAMEFPR